MPAPLSPAALHSLNFPEPEEHGEECGGQGGGKRGWNHKIQEYRPQAEELAGKSMTRRAPTGPAGPSF